MPNPISPVLLEKYLAGQCNDQEKEQVEAWYASLQGEAAYFDQLPEKEQVAIKDNTWGSIKSELNFQPARSAKIIPWRLLTGIAASILVMLGIFLNYQKNTKPHTVTEQLEQMGESHLVRFVNNEPRIVLYRLPDSSSVAMHPGAVITYPKTFEAGQRLVIFTGEGFFNIQKDKTRPFSIQSGEMVVKVLGTSFNVKAPASERLFQVDVVTGSVEVTAPGKETKAQQVILKPKQQALFELESRKLITKSITGQTRKPIYEPVTIVFEETPLQKVAEQLEKRFNIQINLSEGGMSRCRVTANFESQPLPSILEMLCTTLDAHYTLSGNTITINGTPCE